MDDDRHGSLFQKEVTPGYTASLYEALCIKELNKAGDLTHLRELAHRHIKRLGFTDFSLGRMQSPNPEAAMIMLTWESDMVDPYKDPVVWGNDMVLQYAKLNTEPIYQSRINQYINSADFITEAIRTNRYTQEIVQGYGYYDYYNSPIPAANGEGNILLALTAKGVEQGGFKKLVDESRAAIEIFGRALDYVATKRFSRNYIGSNENPRVVIAPRSMQLLELIGAHDLTLKEAAVALNIEISTANQHIRAAREALGTKTTSTAIHLATKLGII